MGQLKGLVAFVSGASRGIGRAIALELAGQGALVAGSATTEAGAADIQKALDAIGPGHLGVALDVTDSAACERVVADVEKRIGAIAVLVNNAGITRDNLA
ncbi:MAG: SDR family NAD(P)-dependent oxidoreductase, partial [Rhodocyclaceae bacterium]|nr:SDR family NAD(P)-dependent oxidoreductase [Rhodocyclaceae bacterium]